VWDAVMTLHYWPCDPTPELVRRARVRLLPLPLPPPSPRRRDAEPIEAKRPFEDRIR